MQDSPLGGSLREMLSLIFEIESKVPPFLEISFLPFSGVFSFVFLGKYLCTFYTKKKKKNHVLFLDFSAMRVIMCGYLIDITISDTI